MSRHRGGAARALRAVAEASRRYAPSAPRYRRRQGRGAQRGEMLAQERRRPLQGFLGMTDPLVRLDHTYRSRDLAQTRLSRGTHAVIANTRSRVRRSRAHRLAIRRSCNADPDAELQRHPPALHREKWTGMITRGVSPRPPSDGSGRSRRSGRERLTGGTWMASSQIQRKWTWSLHAEEACRQPDASISNTRRPAGHDDKRRRSSCPR